jgi:hypothetical protein
VDGQPASTADAADESYGLIIMGAHTGNGGPTVPAPAHLAGTARQQHHRQPDGVQRAERAHRETVKDEDDRDKFIGGVEDAEEGVMRNGRGLLE